MSKQLIIAEIIKREGGYVNDPLDRGGETNYGITKAVALENGYTGNIKDMPKSVAEKIYEDRYLKPIKYDEIEKLSPKVAELLADIAVNKGVGRAGQFLQACLNPFLVEKLKIDGQIGKKTIDALDEFLDRRKRDGEQILFMLIIGRNIEHYHSIATADAGQAKFLAGWINRTQELMKILG